MCERPNPAGVALSTPAVHLFPPASLRLLGLAQQDCRWPLGEPSDETFRFCSSPRQNGSYCAAHRKLARGGRA